MAYLTCLIQCSARELRSTRAPSCSWASMADFDLVIDGVQCTRENDGAMVWNVLYEICKQTEIGRFELSLCVDVRRASDRLQLRQQCHPAARFLFVFVCILDSCVVVRHRFGARVRCRRARAGLCDLSRWARALRVASGRSPPPCAHTTHQVQCIGRHSDAPEPAARSRAEKVARGS